MEFTTEEGEGKAPPDLPFGRYDPQPSPDSSDKLRRRITIPVVDHVDEKVLDVSWHPESHSSSKIFPWQTPVTVLAKTFDRPSNG